MLLHEGGVQTQPGGINDCNGISGPIVDIVNRTTDEVDLFITGHTHSAYNCVIDGRPVTSASSFGRLITQIDLELDRRSREVVSVAADNRIVTQSVIRRLAADATRAADDSGENSMGNLIADAQLAATDRITRLP